MKFLIIQKNFLSLAAQDVLQTKRRINRRRCNKEIILALDCKVKINTNLSLKNEKKSLEALSKKR